MLLREREPLVPATLVARRNRFVAELVRGDGSTLLAHVANTGRLPRLMEKGREVRFRKSRPGLATDGSLALVRCGTSERRWISLETPLANRVFPELLRARAFPELLGERVVAAEHTVGDSRFDFLLADAAGRERLVEVKSANLFEKGDALWPDAPSERGRKHLEHLRRHAKRGGRAALVFVLMGGKAARLRPAREIDPEFAALLLRAERDGVLLLAAQLRFTPRGAEFERSIPVDPRG